MLALILTSFARGILTKSKSVMQPKAKARESEIQAERRAALADLAAYDQEIGI